MEKICAYPTFPTQKCLRSVPYMGRKAKNFRAYYIQDIHLGHTFRITFITYIQKLHFQHTLELHQICPVHLLAHCSLIYSLIYRTTQNSTHFIYIQNIHLEYTLELHPFYIHALARIYVHYNSIQKLHFQHTLDFHWAYPVHSLVHSLARSFTHLSTAPLLAPILIGVLSHYNYIQNIHQNYIHFSLDYLLRVYLLHYNYIQKLHFNLH